MANILATMLLLLLLLLLLRAAGGGAFSLHNLLLLHEPRHLRAEIYSSHVSPISRGLRFTHYQ